MSKKLVVSIFNPFTDAYCELDIETAKKLITSAKEVEKEIKKIEREKE